MTETEILNTAAEIIAKHVTPGHGLVFEKDGKTFVILSPLQIEQLANELKVIKL
jgi:uncharacterized protein (AIM24 family)